MGHGSILLCCALVALGLALPSCGPGERAQESLKVEHEPRISQITPAKPPKIKLRRLSDGKYTWEITASDTNDVLEADSMLREKLLKEGISNKQ